MAYPDVYLYSPLSAELVKTREGKALLVQYILCEFFHCVESKDQKDLLGFMFSTPACFFPFDWSFEVGCLNKIAEHSQLLFFAFDQMDDEIDDFHTILTAIIEEVITRKKTGESILYSELLEAIGCLYSKLCPFLIACKESENLVLFLLRHSQQIGSLSNSNPKQLDDLIMQMFPEKTFEKMHRDFEERGFQDLQIEFDELIAQYERQ